MLTSGQSCSQLHRRLFFCPQRCSISYSEVTEEFFCLRSHMDVQGATIFVCMAQSSSSADDVTAGGALLLLLLLISGRLHAAEAHCCPPQVRNIIYFRCLRSLGHPDSLFHLIWKNLKTSFKKLPHFLCNFHCSPNRHAALQLFSYTCKASLYFIGTIQTQGNPKHLEGIQIHQELHLKEIKNKL